MTTTKPVQSETEVVNAPATDPSTTRSHLIPGMSPVFDQPIATVDHPVAPVSGSTVLAATASGIVPTSGRQVRKGKIARLPKLQRDMVNRMLQNNIPYPKIVGALDDAGIHATQRNISNWRTRGGYKEWCAEQERQLQLSLMQDHLTDYLRDLELMQHMRKTRPAVPALPTPETKPAENPTANKPLLPDGQPGDGPETPRGL